MEDIKDTIVKWLNTPANGWVAGIIALVVVAIVTNLIQEIVRILASVIEFVLILVGAIVVYTITVNIEGSNKNLLILATIMGVIVGLFTVPLMPYKKQDKTTP